MKDHTLISLHQGPAGRVQPQIVGTRLYVHQVMARFRASGDDADEAARYFLIPVRLDAALAYYAEHHEEADADAAVAEPTEREEGAQSLRC